MLAADDRPQQGRDAVESVDRQRASDLKVRVGPGFDLSDHLDHHPVVDDHRGVGLLHTHHPGGLTDAQRRTDPASGDHTTQGGVETTAVSGGRQQGQRGIRPGCDLSHGLTVDGPHHV